jgi:aryl-alcohol dehydrogenase-like predicted oxidoreductase
MSYRQTRPSVPFLRLNASQLSDFGRPRASPCNDTPYESEITTARLKLKSHFRRTLPRFADGALEANLAVVDVVRSVAEEQRATPAQVALAWLRYRAEALGIASVPIPGTRRASRVEENLGSLSVTLTPTQLTALDAAGAAVAGNRTDDLTGVSAGRE